ncbi:putative receptor protein kinase [Trifolium repens]|nr:putative receptor protein kinase [Trifolium repens]
MPNGSLSYQLSIDGANKLTWPQRKNIILDVVKGLIKPPIFHGDIKATNILLDSKMKAKVADFGLAKQGNEGKSHLTTRVAGTYGYLAPEYALYGQLTEKSDVYSFGIVILEVMSGRKVLDTMNLFNLHFCKKVEEQHLILHFILLQILAQLVEI